MLFIILSQKGSFMGCLFFPCFFGFGVLAKISFPFFCYKVHLIDHPRIHSCTLSKFLILPETGNKGQKPET
jgi:hypothetical protein